MDTKPKKRPNGSWLNLLFGPVTLDFVAPFPLDVSLKRIKQQEDTRYFRRHNLMVDLIPDDADTFGFLIKRRGGYQAPVEAHGYMKRWETESTLVTASVNLTRGNLLFWVLGMALAFGVMATLFFEYFIEYTIWFLVPIALLLFVNVYTMNRQRREIARLIEETLRAEVDADIPSTDSNQ
jgi:Mg2+/citrate symporter